MELYILVPICIYKKNALFLAGEDMEDKKVIEIINHKRFKASSLELKFLISPQGRINGDLTKNFLIDFDTTQAGYAQIFNHKGKKYTGIQSIGMSGKYIDNTSFKAKFYNCFGDIIFNEDLFDLIHEGFPSDSSKNI